MSFLLFVFACIQTVYIYQIIIRCSNPSRKTEFPKSSFSVLVGDKPWRQMYSSVATSVDPDSQGLNITVPAFIKHPVAQDVLVACTVVSSVGRQVIAIQ